MGKKRISVHYRNHNRGIGAYQLCAVLFSAREGPGTAVGRLPVQFGRFFALLHCEPSEMTDYLSPAPKRKRGLPHVSVFQKDKLSFYNMSPCSFHVLFYSQ